MHKTRSIHRSTFRKWLLRTLSLSLGLGVLGLAGTVQAQNQAPILLAGVTNTTGSTGGSAPLDMAQPTLAVKWFICVSGLYPERDGSPASGAYEAAYMGEIRCMAFDEAPAGWLPCDGRLLGIATNQVLASLLANTYGGDFFQSNTIALPDLRGRVPVGTGQANFPGDPDAALGYVLGASGGAQALALSVSNLPSHTHLAGTQPTSATGGGAAFDTLQPYLALNICMQGSGTNDSIGWIRVFAFPFTPRGFYPCHGGTEFIPNNLPCYNKIGYTYGNPSPTMFGIPDLRGRSLLGAGTGSGLTPRNLGEKTGGSSHTLSLLEMPTHAHALPQGSTAVNGSGHAFNNMKPGLVFNAAIATNGLPFASHESPALGELRFYACALPAAGYHAADGHALATNDVLFPILGTNFGSTAGTNFLLPDLRGRLAESAAAHPVGASWGTETMALSITNLPAHTHTYVPASDFASSDTANVAEGQTNVLFLAATDADLPPQVLTFTISGGADAASFDLDAVSGALSFHVPPNHEAPTDANLDNIYEVSVTVTDNGSPPLSATLGLSVVVTDVVEMPLPGLAFTTNTTLGIPLTVKIIDGPYPPSSGDGGPVWLTAVTGNPGSVATTDGTNVTYIPLEGVAGYFIYHVTNSDGGVSNQTVQVSISPNPGYNLLSVSRDGGGASVAGFRGAPGVRYALEATPSLETPAWTALSTNLAPPNGWLWFTNTPDGPRKFFRTRHVP